MSANQTRPLKKRVKSFGAAAIRERRRHDFLVGLVDGADVFDIGCGNDSPDKFGAVRPDIRYVGLAVGVLTEPISRARKKVMPGT